MADGAFPGLVSKDRNVNAVTNEIYVGITDGTEQLLITASGEASVIVNNAAGASAVNIQDGGNSITVDGTVAISGTVTVSATDLDIRDLTHVTDSVSIGDGGSIILDIAVSGVAAGATDNGIAAKAIRDDALTTLVDADGDYVGLRTDSTGALWIATDDTLNVNIVSGGLTTGEVHDYDTAAAVVSDATDNHDYTVTGAGTNATFILQSVIFSGSGSVKAEIQTGPVAGLATVAVGFLTGRQGDTQQLTFNPPIEVPTTGTGTVRVIRTNRQGAATDLYSTIIGIEA